MQNTKKGQGATPQGAPSSQPPGRRTVSTSSRFGWTAFGFVLGIGVWHAVGFWSFITAVALNGKPPERASITAAILTTETEPTSETIAPPSPVLAKPPTRAAEIQQTPERSQVPPAGARPQPEAEPAPRQATAPEAPAERRTGGMVVFAQPEIGRTAPASAPVPSAPAPVQPAQVEPTREVATAGRVPPETNPPAKKTPHQAPWATRIITGTID